MQQKARHFLIRDFKSLVPLGGYAYLAGRILSFQKDGLVLTDGLDECVLKIKKKQVAVFKSGDFAKVLVEKKTNGFWIHELIVFQKESGQKEFPDPQGDFYRLQKNGQKRARILSSRSDILRLIRDFFYQEGFLEIEAPLLVPSPGLEVHLEGLKLENSPHYLITSPEYQLKRLLCSGLQKIYSLGKVFRGQETGAKHNPEFTMLEWYRAFAHWSELVNDVEMLCATLASFIHGTPCVQIEHRSYDLTPPWPKLSVRQAAQLYAGIDIKGDESIDELRQKILAKGYSIPNQKPSWDDLFFSVFVTLIEPGLATYKEGNCFRPVVLYDWPMPLCALAQKSPTQPYCVERFEAYVGTFELCNGFGELTDEAEQRKRLMSDLSERKKRRLPLYPIDEKFLFSLKEGIPPSSGVAMGVDRLIMILLGIQSIEEVLPFSIQEV